MTKKKTRRGRPPKLAVDKFKRVVITLPPELDTIAIEAGQGNRSQGIQKALRHFDERNGETMKSNARSPPS